MATKVTAPAAVTTATPDTAPAPRRRGPSLNRVSLIGRLTADPKLRYTSNGTAVTSFRIANNGTDEVQFHTVVVWRRLAEVAAEYLAKGRLVYVAGRLKSRTWTAPDGTDRWVLEVIAEDIQFISPKATSPAPELATAV